MTADLRDQLADFEAAARRLTTKPAPSNSQTLEHRALVLVHARPATCHPDRPLNARGLCRKCYQRAYIRRGLVDIRVVRKRDDFIADYVLLRSEGYTRQQIADRMRMTRSAVNQAYMRAVRAGELEPDRRTA